MLGAVLDAYIAKSRPSERPETCFEIMFSMTRIETTTQSTGLWAILTQQEVANETT